MALFSRLAERRTISPATLFGTGLDTLGFGTTDAGVKVDPDTALRASPIWAAQKLISDDVSNLPVRSFIDENDTRHPYEKYGWMTAPDPRDPNLSLGGHFQQVVLAILQYGRAYIYCEGGVGPDAKWLDVLPPSQVKVTRSGMSPEYHVLGAGGRSVKVLTPEDVIHIAPFRKPGALDGLSPIEAAAEGIGLGIAAERYTARFFGQGALMPGFVEVPAGASADTTEMEKEFRKARSGWRKSGLAGFLTGGAKWVQSGVNPKDADLSAIREYQVEEACRIYGIPPHKLGSQKPGAVGFASIEQRSIDYVQSLAHYIVPLETAYKRLTRGDSTYIKFNVAALLRGDMKSRFEAYGLGLDKGFLSANDVLRWEDMAGFDGGDVHRVLMQTQDSNTVDFAAKANAVGALVRAGFVPEDAAAAVGLTGIAHTGLVPVTIQGEAVATDTGEPKP